MIFTLISEETEQVSEINLPCSEQELTDFCVSVSDKNTSTTKVTVSKISESKELFLLLGRNIYNLDELNFFVKALTSLKTTDKELFFIVAGGNMDISLSFLVNLCYNLHCYSVISDFSCLHL